MAQGNIYLLVPKIEKDNPVPLKLKDKWQFKETPIDQNGEPTGEPIIIHPSWLKAANRLKTDFGEIIEITYNAQQFLVIELELSFIDGEVAEVQKLQSNQVAKKAWYRILTNDEAKRLIGGEDVFLWQYRTHYEKQITADFSG